MDYLTDNDNPWAPREIGAVSRGVPFSTGHSPREQGPQATSECSIRLRVAFRIFPLYPPMDCLVINHEFGTWMQLSLPRVPGTATQVLSDFFVGRSKWKRQVQTSAFPSF